MDDLREVQETRRKQIETHAAAVMAEDAATHIDGVSVVQTKDNAERSYDQPFEPEQVQEVPDVVEPVAAPVEPEPSVEPAEAVEDPKPVASAKKAAATK
jgi:hypothetical protein